MNLKTILLIALVIIALAGAYVWFFVYNKKHTNIENEKAHYKVTDIELVKEFEANFDSAHKKYNNKVIEITGTVARVDKVGQGDSLSSITFTPSAEYEILCEVYSKYHKDAQALAGNDKIVLKGLYILAEKPDPMFEASGSIKLKKSSFEKKQ